MNRGLSGRRRSSKTAPPPNLRGMIGIVPKQLARLPGELVFLLLAVRFVAYLTDRTVERGFKLSPGPSMMQVERWAVSISISGFGLSGWLC